MALSLKSAFRLGYTLPRIALHLMVAVAIVGFGFPFLSHPRRQLMIRWWSLRVLAICGIKLRVVQPTFGAVAGEAADRGRTIASALRPGGIGAMLLMNHVSWVDIYLVHSLRAARFVAKAEIARWPLAGYLTRGTGTIFIERGRRRAVHDANQRVAALLAEGELVGMFPEGTTSDGDRLLPFHSNLIKPAIDARVPIVIAGLRYLDRHGRPTTAAAYVGDESLVASMLRVVISAPLTAEVHLIDVIDGAATTRHEIAERARTLIGAALGFRDADAAGDEVATVMVVPGPPCRVDDVERFGRVHGAVSRAAGPRDSRPSTPIDPRDELL